MDKRWHTWYFRSMENLETKQNIMEQGSDFWGGGSTSLRHGQVALFRITDVNDEKRTCTIKTYGASLPVANGDYENVQWLSPYSSILGDEVSFVPEPNAQGVCIFEGNQPWIIGFFNPVTIDPEREIPDQEREGVEPSGASAAANKEKVNVGDFIFRTAGRCRVVLRRGGEIELEATKLCRRTYFPARNLINELSQNYEFRTDGGTIDWIHPNPQSDKTYFRQEWRDDVSRTNVLVDEKGSIVEGSTLIHRFAITPGNIRNAEVAQQPKPVFLRETFNDGKTQFKINEFSYTEEILPDGSYTQGVEGYKFFQNIKPTGEFTINVNNNWQQKILPTGEMTLDIGIEKEKEEKIKPTGGKGKFSFNVKPTGETSLKVNEKVNMTLLDSGEVTIDSNGRSTITITPSGEVSIKTSQAITCDSPSVNLLASAIKLGRNVADSVPLGKLLVSSINKIVDTFNNHNHQVPQAPAGVLPSQPPLIPAQTVGNDVLSSSVEVQP